MVRDTLLDFFSDLARCRGEFLVYDDGFRSWSYTYPQVGAYARGFAVELAQHGVGKGDKVLVWSENRPEWIIAFWGCLLAGAVVVPIDYRASADFLTRIARVVSAKLALVGHDVVVPADLALPVWTLHDHRWSAAAAAPAVLAAKDDVVEIIFTSGATAEPKGVVITHRNVLANIGPVEGEVLKYRKWGRPFFPLRFLNLLPLSHMFGQAMATFIPPMLPGTVVFMRGHNPADIVHQIKKRRVSVLVSVPKILDVLKTAVEPAVRQATTGAGGIQAPSGEHVARRWWRYRRLHRMFGVKFWCFVVGAAPLETALEAFWSELGFLVVQGYGLTETAPIVSLNHPLFGTKQGSVGKAIAGVEVKIAPDGEILVRGDNVTSGYFNAAGETASAFEDGWFHTGDIGEIGSDGALFVRGRKKEMIVTPEGLNVFPEDVERVLNAVPGVRESAVVGVPFGAGEERVHAALVLEAGTDVDDVVRTANAELEEHQKIRRGALWPGAALPRTEGTAKLKRAAVREWFRTGTAPQPASAGADRFAALLAKYSGRGELPPGTTIDELGLSSLDRVELMVALEDAFQTPIDEARFAEARSIGDLRALVDRAGHADTLPAEPVDFPSWNRRLPARAIRRVSLPTWLLPLARLFAWIRVDGGERVRAIEGPVIFASNHQSHLDTPVILAALPRERRYTTTTAMAKEFFKAHFFPDQYGRGAWFTNSLNYYLASLFFFAFPLPQREAGARQTLRYIGELLEDGYSVLIFPEGKRTEHGEIDRFRAGIGMIASRLQVPVVPVRIEGLDRVLHHTWMMARPGRVRVAFGEPLRLTGDDYDALAAQVRSAVARL